MRKRRGSLVHAVIVMAAAACGSAATDSSGNNAGRGLTPTGNVTISGDHTYSSVSIPAGVTVTVSSNATLTVDSAFTLSGTLVAPCHNLVISAGGAAKVTGTIRNDCSDTTVAGAELDLIAKGGYDLEGATITSSGDIFVLDGPTQPVLSIAPSKDASAIRLSASGRSVSAAAAALASFRCQMVNTTISTIPPTAQDGTNGNPDGTPGSAGRSKTVGCGQSITGQTGGNLLINGLTLNGGNGGDGGTGTSNVGASSHGGAGGPAGGLQIVSDADIVIQGATINGGSGGNGGSGTSTAASAGGSASAFGGAGGPLKPKNYSSPLTISAGGALTIGGLTINLGNGGSGGAATATAKDGAPGPSGQPGGTATGSGGVGGASTPNTLTATGAISGLSGVVVTGGRGGNGGAAVFTAGNGGSGTAQSGVGGPGGGASGSGGNGGDGGTRTGGNGGPATFTGGNGGGGGAGVCGNPVIAGGPGGNGGTQSGGGGAGGSGNSPGAPGAVSIVNSFNGGPGGSPDGKGGKAGTGGKAGPPGDVGEATSAAAGFALATSDSTSNSFKPGPDADGCAAKPLAISAALQTPNVTEGGVGTALVSVIRSGGFTGAVTVTVKDPQSVVRATTTIPATGTSATVNFEIPINAGTGSGVWTIVGSGTGVADDTQTVSITIGAPAGETITYNNCDPSRVRLWVATQDGNGPLVPRAVNTTTGSVTFTVASNTATVATVDGIGSNSFSTWVWQGTSAELATVSGPCPPQAKSSLAGIATNAVVGKATFSVGAATQSVTVSSAGSTQSWVVTGITAGTHTLTALNMNQSGLLMRDYINRSTNTTGTTPVDFLSAALSGAPATGGLSILNLPSGVPTIFTLGYIPLGETSPSPIQTGTVGGPTVPLTGLTPSLLVPGDLYQITVTSAGSADTRQVTGYFSGLPTALSKLTIPNALTFTHTCISPPGSPTRARVDETVDPNVSDFWTLQLSQGNPTAGSRSFWMFQTAGFAGATPGSPHSMVMPDLGAIGAPASSLLQPNTATAVTKTAVGSNLGGAATAAPKDQLVIFLVAHVDSFTCQ
jgi:hypothetical protein